MICQAMTAHLAHAFRWQICHLPKFVGGNWSTWRKPIRTSTLVPTKAYNRSPDPGAVSHKCFRTANFFLYISTSNVNDVCKQWGNSCVYLRSELESSWSPVTGRRRVWGYGHLIGGTSLEKWSIKMRIFVPVGDPLTILVRILQQSFNLCVE